MPLYTKRVTDEWLRSAAATGQAPTTVAKTEKGFYSSSSVVKPSEPDVATHDIVRIDVHEHCFPVCAHTITIHCRNGTSTSKSGCSGEDIVTLISESGVYTRENRHPLWSHFEPFHPTPKYAQGSALRSCRYNKAKPQVVQVTSLASRNREIKAREIEDSLKRGEITQSVAEDRYVEYGIKDEDGKVIKTVVAERSKSSGFTSRAKPVALNKKDKKRRRSWTKTSEPYPLSVQNVVSKGAYSETPPVEWLKGLMFSSYVPQEFPSSSVNLKFPRSCVSKYNTRQTGCAGASSDYAGMLALTLVAARHTRTLGRVVQLQEFAPCNFTTSADIGVPIDLIKLKDYIFEHFEDEIEPKYLPGVINMLQLKNRPKNPDGTPAPLPVPSSSGKATKGKKTKSSSPATNISPSGRLCIVGFPDSASIWAHAPWYEMIHKWAHDNYDPTNAATAPSVRNNTKKRRAETPSSAETSKDAAKATSAVKSKRDEEDDGRADPPTRKRAKTDRDLSL